MVYSLQGPTGTHHLAMVAKRVYRVSGGRCWAETGMPRLTEVAEHAPSTNTGALDRLVADTDLFAPLKPATDVLLSGSACSTRGAVRVLDTAVKVGPVQKNVRVWGERRLQLGATGRLRFSDPEPFTSMPLVWDHAYGGRDVHAEGKLRIGERGLFGRCEETGGAIVYPRNPAGRGFFIDLERERLAGAVMPRLEDPEDPVLPDRLLAKNELDWLDRPAAASYGPVDWTTFPRVAFWLGAEALPPSREIYEVRRRALRAEEIAVRALGSPVDPRAYVAAPLGLHGARLLGNERVSLWNLHPRHAFFEVDLPADRPRMLLEPPGCGIYELPPVLQTVLIEPDEERVTLTWSGVLEVAAPFLEEACEAMRRAVRWLR
jgi:hypothetical protein